MAESPEQAPSEDGNSFLEDELEALRSIYINETDVYEDNETTVVSIDLHPATADNLQEQYVKLTLKLTIKDGYPDVLPEIDIRNPRGLSDEILSSITSNCLKIAEDMKGKAMLFEIIEVAKDFITAGNRPCEECAICLYGFHDDDIFTKTECYHCFHSHCLARYAKNSSKCEEESKPEDSSETELLCPVCRLPIHFDGVDDSYPSPVKCDDEFSVTDTILQTQKKLQELYIKQVEKGGIIDLEAEKNKYLIEISHVPSVVDASPETKSEEEMSLKAADGKGKIQSSSPENAQNDKLDSQNRPSNSERPYRKFTKYNEDRRRNEMSRPYHGNDYRNERYQNNRGGDGYRRDPRNRNNYDRRYDGYNNDRSDRYASGMNRNRYSNPRRNNWHDNQFKSNRYDGRDKFEDRNSQQYEKHNKYDDRSAQQYEGRDRNSQKYERPDKYHDRNREMHDKTDDRSGQKFERYDKNDDRNRQKYERSDKNDDRNEQKYERPDKNDDRNGQKYERHDKNGDRNEQKYERHDKNNDRNSHWYDKPRSQRKKPDPEEGVLHKDDADEDRSYDVDKSDEDVDKSDNVQDDQVDKGADERRNNRYSGDRRNVNYSGSQRNNQYDDRRENRYERRNVRYDNNKRYNRYEDGRNGQYDRRNGRFDSRKYNDHNGPRRNENFVPGSNNRTHRYPNPENEATESKFSKENEVDAKNSSAIEKESESMVTPHETAGGGNVNESEYPTEGNASGDISSKDKMASEVAEKESESQAKSSSYSSDGRHKYPNRNSGLHRQNDGRNYNRHYQRSNSNGDRYSKHSNYHSERRQAKPQNFRGNSDNTDEAENSTPFKSNEAVDEGAGEANESNLEERQAYNNEETGDLSDGQHSKKSSMRTDSGNVNHHKNYREGKQGYNNRYQNNSKDYQENRPYRNNPRTRNNQNDYSDRTSNSSKRYIPQKYANNSSQESPQIVNDSEDNKPKTISKESSADSVSVDSNKPTVPPKSSELQKSVPTSNFLPPMSSVAPPPGFQNPTRKIVYGLAAANPPPGFNRS